MGRIEFDGEYFNVEDTLSCGQVFRFVPYKNGFRVISRDKFAYCYNENGKGIIECEDNSEEYFKNYFDLERDYSLIVNFAHMEKEEIICKSATLGKGGKDIKPRRGREFIFFYSFPKQQYPPN